MRLFVRMLLLNLILLSISRGVLADQWVSEKPEDWDRRLDMLRSVPYIAFSETVVEEGDTGVVFHNQEKTQKGYNFYCTRSSGEAFVLDMNGCVVHQWKYPPKKGAGSDHALMLENGDLLVVKKFDELIRLDWDSNTIWRRKLRVHHDVSLAPDSSIYTILRGHETHRGMRVWFDTIAHLTPEGQELRRWSTYDHLVDLQRSLDTRSFLDTVLDSAMGGRSPGKKLSNEVKKAIADHRYNFDYFHINTVNLLPATSLGDRDQRFRAGNLLVCFRNVNQIAVLEKDTYRILWVWGEGQLEWPHHPAMLGNGHMLIFDNGVEREYSRVVELDPVSGAIVWEYMAEFPEDFFSYARGSVQRLANGNTLISESDNGRVFEVTRGGEVVWIWLNPVRKKGHRETVYRMMRLPEDLLDPLLNEWWWWN